MDGFYQRRRGTVQMELLCSRVTSDDGVASCSATNVLLQDLSPSAGERLQMKRVSGPRRATQKSPTGDLQAEM
jgi:hypothetical protein